MTVNPEKLDIEQLTREQVMERYGNVLMSFKSYYKYSFTYAGDAGERVEVAACVGGGSADDIYKMNVGTKPIRLAELGDDLAYVQVTRNGPIVAEWDGH